jgi:flagellar basal body-associated protein FliL
MDGSQYSTLRNLLVLIVVLLMGSVGSVAYLSLEMNENSRVFGKIYDLLESGMNEELIGAMAQAQAIQQELEKVRVHAASASAELAKVDNRMQQAEAQLVERMKKELPPLMDKYVDHLIETRSEQVSRELAKEEVRQVLREEVAKVIREEMARALPGGSR